VAVAGKLDPIGEPPCNIIDELLGAFAIATADEISGDKLRIGVHCNPCPHVPSSG